MEAEAGRGVILSEAKDLAVPASGLLAVRITGAVTT
jgi:hypothetical protein